MIGQETYSAGSGFKSLVVYEMRASQTRGPFVILGVTGTARDATGGIERPRSDATRRTARARRDPSTPEEEVHAAKPGHHSPYTERRPG